MLRVGYVVCRFDMGGLERVAAHLANGLDRAVFEPFIFCLERTGAAAGWLNEEHVPIIELHKREGNDPSVVLRLARSLRAHGIDVVHSHNWGTLVETTLARRLARTPVHVHAEHGQELDSLRTGGLRRLARSTATRWALARADTVVVCAESVRDRIHRRTGFAAANMLCIPNGVDPPPQPDEESRKLRGELGITDGALVVGSLSRLVPVKDFGTAIEMLAHCPAELVDVHLVLVGDGPEESSLRERAAVLGVSGRVHLVGRREDVGAWLSLFDVYLNSSLSEALSMGLLEAMSLGLPSVVTDVGDHASVVGGDDSCGLVVPPAAPRELGLAVGRLASSKELRDDFGSHARKRYLDLYTTARMVEDYASLYRRLHRHKAVTPAP